MSASPHCPVTEAPVLPRLAQDIELLGQYQGSGCTEPPYLIRLSDGRMLEVSWLLHLVASALRHEADLRAVAARVTAECGRPISPNSVMYVIEAKLRPLGIVEESASPPTAATAAPPVLGLAVHARVIPEWLVGALASFLRPLFLPPVVAGALAGLIAVDAWLLLGPGARGAMDQLLLHPELSLAVLGITLLAGVFHELGHATASRYGGAKPGVIGAGIYLLWPVFYNDLNDSYRLSRAGRLRADLGGVYFNGLCILILAAAYQFTGLEVFVAAIVVQHLAVLQQFVPFLRLDGYYIVSDLAGVPDLFARIRPVLSGLVGRRGTQGASPLTARAQAVVTVWVVLSVPLLAACVGLLLASIPGFVAVAVESIILHGKALAAGLAAGAVLKVAMSGLLLAAVSVPLLGMTAVLIRILRLTSRSIRGRHFAVPVTPVRHALSPLSPAGGPIPLPLAPKPVRQRPLLWLLSGLVVVLAGSFAAGNRLARSR